MKNHLFHSLLLFTFIIPVYSLAQLSMPLDTDAWSKFQSGKLYVVLENDEESEFSKSLKDACTNNWTFNEVEFIDSSKYESLNKTKDNFFLVQAIYPLKMGKNRYIMNQLELKRINKKGKEVIVASMFQESLNAGYSDDVNLIHLPLYVLSIQSMCTKGLKGEKNGVKQKTAKMAQIKTKPLYILDSHFTDQVSSMPDLKKLYNGEVIEVSIEELSEIIEKKEDVNLFVFNSGIDKDAPVLRNKYGYANVLNLKSGDLMYSMQVYISKQYPAGLSKYLCRNWSR